MCKNTSLRVVLLNYSLSSIPNIQSSIDNLGGYQDCFNEYTDTLTTFYLITGKYSSENVSVSPSDLKVGCMKEGSLKI